MEAGFSSQSWNILPEWMRMDAQRLPTKLLQGMEKRGAGRSLPWCQVTATTVY